MATAERAAEGQRPVLHKRLHDHRQLIEPRRVSVGDHLPPDLVGDVELHALVVARRAPEARCVGRQTAIRLRPAA